MQSIIDIQMEVFIDELNVLPDIILSVQKRNPLTIDSETIDSLKVEPYESEFYDANDDEWEDDHVWLLLNHDRPYYKGKHPNTPENVWTILNAYMQVGSKIYSEVKFRFLVSLLTDDQIEYVKDSY